MIFATMISVRLFLKKDDLNYNTCDKVDAPMKHDLIMLLAVGGQWVTSCPRLQVGAEIPVWGHSDEGTLRSGDTQTRGHFPIPIRGH